MLPANSSGYATPTKWVAFWKLALNRYGKILQQEAS